jgi:hypothetical protein
MVLKLVIIVRTLIMKYLGFKTWMDISILVSVDVVGRWSDWLLNNNFCKT